MILIRFLKQQNWWYSIACVTCLVLFHYISVSIGWSLLFASSFLIFYSLKFAEKYNNQFIDRIKLFFYFLYFSLFFLSTNLYGTRELIKTIFPFFAFIVYFYTLLIFYKNEMEKKGTTIKKSYWLTIVVIQTFLIAGMAIWAITQKVEATKQKMLALNAEKNAAEKAKESNRLALIEKDETAKAKAEFEKQIIIAEQAKAEALVYKQLYENSLKHKK